MELMIAGQAGECLQPSQGLFLHSDEKASFLLSNGPIPYNGDGGKAFMCYCLFPGELSVLRSGV